MTFAANFPFFGILLALLSGIVASVLKPRAARFLTVAVSAVVLALSVGTLMLTMRSEEPIRYMMGHFPAPWGNELRFGPLEALVMTGFSLVVLLSLLGGFTHMHSFVSQQKLNLYCIMVLLSLVAIQVLVYTNDLFTAYVFIEIMTIASCALVIVRQNGHTLAAATRYMIMNLLASGLVLLGISMLYGITGHLLMEPLGQATRRIAETGHYQVPLTVVIALIAGGLAIKSALYLFHAWAPDFYAFAPPMSSAILSGVISKAYIFLLLKFFYRVIGMDILLSTQIEKFLFVCGVAGMIMGSVMAISQRDVRRMIAYSSVAQIGLVYLAIGIGSQAAVGAAVFQMLSHAAAKSMLFLSTYELVNVSGDRKRFHYLHGAGYRSVVGGVVFTVGAMSLVGIPLTGGFIAKLNVAIAGMPLGGWMRALVLVTLAISTLLNAVYLLHTVVSIYRQPPPELHYPPSPRMPRHVAAALVLSMLLTVYLGVSSGSIMQLIESGLNMFA